MWVPMTKESARRVLAALEQSSKRRLRSRMLPENRRSTPFLGRVQATESTSASEDFGVLEPNGTCPPYSGSFAASIAATDERLITWFKISRSTIRTRY